MHFPMRNGRIRATHVCVMQPNRFNRYVNRRRHISAKKKAVHKISSLSLHAWRPSGLSNTAYITVFQCSVLKFKSHRPASVRTHI
jgi:hypothetical protein